jgi:hypothetical protein
MARQRFPIGFITATPAAFEQLEQANVDPFALIARHASGDYGSALEEGVQINEETIRDKAGTVLSIYEIADGTEVWVATSLVETGGAHTYVLCPSDW